MKRFFSILMVMLAAVTAQAQWLSGTIAGGQTILDTGSGTLGSIQISDTSGSANPVILYDIASTTTTNIVLPTFTARQYYTTNVVKTWTDSQGVTKSRTNSVLFNAPLTVAASTNQATRLYTVTIPANGSVIIEPQQPLGYTYGLSIKNTGAVNYNARIISN